MSLELHCVSERSVFCQSPPGVGDMLKILRESQLKVIEWGSLFTARDADAALMELGVFLMRLTAAVERAQRFERAALGMVGDQARTLVLQEDSHPDPDPAQRLLFPAIEARRVAIGRRVC